MIRGIGATLASAAPVSSAAMRATSSPDRDERHVGQREMLGHLARLVGRQRADALHGDALAGQLRDRLDLRAHAEHVLQPDGVELDEARVAALPAFAPTGEMTVLSSNSPLSSAGTTDVPLSRTNSTSTPSSR